MIQDTTNGFHILAVTLLVAAAACGGGEDAAEEARWSIPPTDTVAPLAPEDRVSVIGGFSAPESVRYDPAQDVWFVGNFGDGEGGARDANGFVSRVDAASGRIVALRFAVGTDARPLHAARGMFIAGDTLWVTDMDGIHAFDRRSGEQLGFVDLSGFEPGFLNDIVQGPDGARYVTDTGRSAVYRVLGGETEVVLRGSELGSPNGITWDPAREALVFVPWAPGGRVHEWRGDAPPVATGPERTPGRLDGVEPFDGGLLVASQSDHTLQLLDTRGRHVLVRTGDGAPADIGVDTRRRRVAAPYVGLNRVDVWALPRR